MAEQRADTFAAWMSGLRYQMVLSNTDSSSRIFIFLCYRKVSVICLAQQFC